MEHFSTGESIEGYVKGYFGSGVRVRPKNELVKRHIVRNYSESVSFSFGKFLVR